MARKGSDRDFTVVTTKEISEILGVTDRRIRQLVNEGALMRLDRGKFNLPESIRMYIDYSLKAEMTEEQYDKQKEETLWVRAKREKTELEVKIIKGELHRSKDVERVMNDMLGSFRARLLSLPTKMAPQVIGKSDLTIIKDLLKDAIYEAMNELADYDPNAFYDHSTDKVFIEEIDDGDEKE